jgi:hypothetical protein
VLIPELPRGVEPNYEDWKKAAGKLSLNENSIVIAHSAGCAFAVRLLGEKEQKISLSDLPSSLMILRLNLEKPFIILILIQSLKILLMKLRFTHLIQNYLEG